MSSERRDSVPPAAPGNGWGVRIVLVLLAAVVVPIGASLLYAFPPTEYAFLPCWFNRMTTLHCPGCGATRCVHALMHGELAQAFAWNPLFVLALPLLIYGLFCLAYHGWTGRRIGFKLSNWAQLALAVILITYWIARNIDVYPLNLLAPHEL